MEPEVNRKKMCHMRLRLHENPPQGALGGPKCGLFPDLLLKQSRDTLFFTPGPPPWKICFQRPEKLPIFLARRMEKNYPFFTMRPVVGHYAAKMSQRDHEWCFSSHNGAKMWCFLGKVPGNPRLLTKKREHSVLYTTWTWQGCLPKKW